MEENTSLMESENSKIRDLYIKKLKRDALEVGEESYSALPNLDSLCQYMSEASFQYKQPIKAVFNDNEFVIDKATPYDKALASYCDQCLKLEERPYSELKDYIDMSNAEHLLKVRSQPNFKDVLATKSAENIINNHPEKAEELDTIQLMNVYLSRYRYQDPARIEELLKESINKYMNGEDTFKANIYNISSLPDLEDVMYKSGMYDMDDIEKRMSQSELKMFDELKNQDLSDCSDASLAFIGKMASKYPDRPEAQSLKEKSFNVVMDRLKSGRTFNPNSQEA